MDCVSNFNMDLQCVVRIMSKFDDWVMDYYEEIWENQEEEICPLD